MGADEKAATRFEREARSMARLSHPNVVDVIEVGEEDGTHYFAMQFIDGRPLDAIIRTEGALPPERVAEVGAQVAEALAHAHEAAVIHRDVKPGNIMIDSSGRAIVTDFGIAKAAMGDGSSTTMTALTQGPIGSPAYMSPEVLKGNPVDGRADLYGLGVVLYEMATGRVPFSAATPYQIATQRLTQDPPTPRTFRADLPEWLESIILRALSKEPADRFGTAENMASALREQRVEQLTSTGTFQQSEAVSESQPGAHPASESQPSSRAPQFAWALAGAGLALLIAAVVIFTINGRTDDDGDPPIPRVTVPGVTSMSLADAQQELQEAGFVLSTSDERHDSSPPGTVIAQQPIGGSSTGEGTTVRLTVSLGPEVVEIGEQIESLYRRVDRILSRHKASNQPWEEWKKIHGSGSGSWHQYVMRNYEDLIASDNSIASAYRESEREARAINVSGDAPGSFSNMLEILADGCYWGAERCRLSADLIRREVDGEDPSWGRNTPYGRAKRQHEDLLGNTGPVGGRAEAQHDNYFYPDLQRLRQR